MSNLKTRWIAFGWFAVPPFLAVAGCLIVAASIRTDVVQAMIVGINMAAFVTFPSSMGYAVVLVFGSRLAPDSARRLWIVSGILGVSCLVGSFSIIAGIIFFIRELFGNSLAFGDSLAPIVALMVALAILILVFSLVVGFLSLRFCLRLGWLKPIPPAGYCQSCGYDLRGSPGPTCPECGTPFSGKATANPSPRGD